MEDSNKHAIVLYSGGLDSRLVVCMLQKQGFTVETLYFGLPFGCGCCNLSCNFKFTQKEEVKMTIFDATKEPLLTEYLELLKNPKYGTGSSVNPCKDCKVFMFKKAYDYAMKKYGKDCVIATGEVLGQRPMSQIRSAMQIIDDVLGFEILRPLSAKILTPTRWETEGIVDREQMQSIVGRSRKVQMKMAKDFEISYPSPGGGCLLCEKNQEKKFKELLSRDLITEKSIPLVFAGRHFMIDDCWFIVARNAKECMVIDNFDTNVEGGKGEPTVYYSCVDGKENAKELQQAFRTGASEQDRAKFDEYKL